MEFNTTMKLNKMCQYLSIFSLWLRAFRLFTFLPYLPVLRQSVRQAFYQSALGSASYNLCASVPLFLGSFLSYIYRFPACWPDWCLPAVRQISQVGRLFTFLPFYSALLRNSSHTSVPKCLPGGQTGLRVVVPFFVFCLFSFILNNYAQEPIGIKECLLLAYKNSNLIQIADLASDGAVYKSEESRSQLFPSLNLSAQYTRIGEVTSFDVPMGPSGEKQSFQFGTPDRLNFDARVQYMLFSWGRVSYTIDIADLGISASRIQYERQKIDLTDQVLRAAYSVAYNQELVVLEEENVKRAESFHRIADQRFRAGSIPKLEVLQAQVQVKSSQSILNESQSNLLSSHLLLEKLTGIPVENQNLNIRLIPVMPPVQEDQAIVLALKNRKDLHLVDEQKKITTNLIRVTRAENKPAVTLFSSFNLQNGFDPVNPSRLVRNWNAGVQIGFPVFNGFATQHRIEQGHIDLQKTELQQKEMKELIRLQVRQAMVAIKKAADKIGIQEENIILAKEALDMTEQQYSNGIVSSLDLLNAQNTLLRTELARAQAVFSLILADLDLCKAMEEYSWFAGIN